ncbi:transposase [Streptomyces nodosus]|nr:transposase [Streptomyces nodosus]
MPALPSRLTEPLWDQFAVLLPQRPEYHPDHPLGCHRRRISDRVIFDKMLQLLRFGCSYEAIADTACSATTIRSRRDEWIRLGVFARLKQTALDAYDPIVGLVLDQIAIDSPITKAPGGGEVAGRSPVDRGKHGLKRAPAGPPKQSGPHHNCGRSLVIQETPVRDLPPG